MTEKLKVLLKGRPFWLLGVAVTVAFLGGILTPVSAPVRGPLIDINDGMMLAVLAFMGVFLANLWLRQSALEAKYGDLWAAREADALIKRRAGDHIDVLEDHIWKGKPPPPPARPDGV